MPYSRISLLKGKSSAYLQAISDNLHRALVERFLVPEDDRFQIFEQLEKHEFIFDRNYLSGPRSDDYLLIAITIGKPRTLENRKKFYHRLTELLQEKPGIHPRDVMVVIHSTNAEDWSFGNGLTSLAGGTNTEIELEKTS